MAAEATSNATLLDGYFLAYVALSSLTSWVTFRYISPALSSRCFTTYRNASLKDKLLWDSYVISQYFVVVASILDVYALLGEELNRDYVWGMSPITQFLCAWMVGHMLIESYIFTVILDDKLFVIHHLASMASAIYIAKNNSCAYLYFFRTLAELPNIFLNSGWFIKFIYGKHSKFFIGNAMIHIAVCVTFRFLTMPFFYFRVMPALWNASPSPPVNAYIVLSLVGTLDVLTCYWFNRMVKGFVRILAETGLKLKV